VEIETGKSLFIRLVNIGAVDAEGKRNVNFELNGMSRQLSIVDRSVKPTVKARVKADPGKPTEVGAPIPGLVTALSVSTGARVSKGDKLVTLEAMKMQTTIYALCENLVHHAIARRQTTVVHDTFTRPPGWLIRWLTELNDQGTLIQLPDRDLHEQIAEIGHYRDRWDITSPEPLGRPPSPALPQFRDWQHLAVRIEPPGTARAIGHDVDLVRP
jgi:biotin carboxyl carrier protein